MCLFVASVVSSNSDSDSGSSQYCYDDDYCY